MTWVAYAVLGLLPAAGFAVAFTLTRRLVPSIMVAGVVGAVLGAFVASGASAMGMAVDLTDARVRGAGVGFLGGVAVGAVAASVAVFRRGRRFW